MSSNTLAVGLDERKIDAVCTDIDQCCLPGAAVGIAINGKPVYRKGFGLASMELPVVLSPTIRMRIGSTSKHFAALAYMLLCEEGRAGIDDPIGRYLPELHPVAHGVTARQLMGHVSGLRDAFDICYQFSGTGRAITSADVLSLYRCLEDRNFAPGTAWNYNNGGYLMLSIAIERISGQPLEHVLRERIFEPVGMYDTMLRRWDTDFVPNSATLHMINPAGGMEKSYIGKEHTGEGGIVSTVDDMLRWLAHMDAPRVGSEATWRAMKSPQVLTNGTSTGYGLGLMTSPYRGVELLAHGGSVMGGNAEMMKVPAAGLDVVILANRHDVSAMLLARRILDVCLPGLKPVSGITSHPLTTGVFRSTATGRVIELLARDGQQIASLDGVDMPVEPDENGVLRPAGVFAYMKQAITPVGDPKSPASIRFSDFGNADELRLAQGPRGRESRTIEARYVAEAIGTEALICRTEDGARLHTRSTFGSTVYHLECLAENIWRAKPMSMMFLGGILSFDAEGAGFRFSSSRTRAIPFRRLND
jgi:D-aminopeptidase